VVVKEVEPRLYRQVNHMKRKTLIIYNTEKRGKKKTGGWEEGRDKSRSLLSGHSHD
jgi:hypothetical protein